ncbi:MAG: PA-phosphatase [Cyclobacteriaceae bacterium]|nr:PA-phosphatase [Cyclobacteriaceae bacterium]
MSKNIAKLISVVAHPLLMPTYLIYLLFILNPLAFKPIESAFFHRIAFVIFIITFVLPAISIFSMKYSSLISSYAMPEKRERIFPFLIVAGFYGVCTYLFYFKLRVNENFYLLLAILTALIILVTLLTIFWKISVHSVAVWGLMGFVLSFHIKEPAPYFQFTFAALSLLAGWVMWSRLRLNAHTPFQVYSGAALGFISCFTAYYFLS